MISNMTKFLFKDETSNNNAFAIQKRTLPAGTYFPPHWHDYLELGIVCCGTLKHTYNNTSCFLDAGNAYIISYFDYHEIKALTDVVLFCIQFNNTFLDEEITQYLSTNSILCQFPKSEAEKVISQINVMLEEQNTAPPFHNLFIKSLLTEIILQMLRKEAPEIRPATPLPIQQVIAYIADNYLHKLTLEDIAAKFFFSPNYLGKLFKLQTGCTFNEYVNQLRLRYACGLLQQTSLAIKDIAVQSGYSSTEYFLYTFKKQLKMTPSEYRQLFSLE